MLFERGQIQQEKSEKKNINTPEIISLLCLLFTHLILRILEFPVRARLNYCLRSFLRTQINQIDIENEYKLLLCFFHRREKNDNDK